MKHAKEELQTCHCFIAIELLHEIFIWKLTTEEKEHEEQWVDSHLEFRGPWKDGWLMYCGAILATWIKW